VFSRLWEAYGHGRLDDALHLIDPDCTLHVSVSDRVYRGHDGVRAGMVEFRKAWKSATLTSDEVVEVDAQTIVVTGPRDRLRPLRQAHLRRSARVDGALLRWRLLEVTSYSSRAEALVGAAEARAGAD
jgi:hypothetical protein